jgi:putative mRNA 3-end processing factor
VAILKHRLGSAISVDSLNYGQGIEINGVNVSLHPAGHVLGASQVRLQHQGQVWVISGDYKLQPDPTCQPFELQRCDTFITECTFGLPIFRWREAQLVSAQINQWWRDSQSSGRTCVLLAYSLGKAQRVLASLDETIGPILLHGAVYSMVEVYRQLQIPLPPAEHATQENAKQYRGRAIVIAPPSAMSSSWVRKFAPYSIGVASGWMQVRGFRRRRAADRGFVLSDHVDWPGLQQTIRETGAEHVIATHGYTVPLARYLAESGMRATTFETAFSDVDEDLEIESSADLPATGNSA